MYTYPLKYFYYFQLVSEKNPRASSLLDIKVPVSSAVHYSPIKLVEVSTFSALITKADRAHFKWQWEIYFLVITRNFLVITRIISRNNEKTSRNNEKKVVITRNKSRNNEKYFS